MRPGPRSLITALLACSTLAAPLSAGSGAWTTSYPFGSSVASGGLAVDPSDPTRLYAHPNWRGLYRSDDSGANWSPLLDGAPTPFDSKHLRFIAADANGHVFLGACCDGSGEDALWGSTDLGTTWTLADAGVTGRVISFAIAPSDSTVRYLGTIQGQVWRSDDGGATWSAAAGGLPGNAIRSLEVDPTSFDTVWAGTEASGIFKTTNGGTAWAGANGDVAMTTVEDILIDPGAPDTVYAADNDGATGKTVYKTVNGGTNWVDLATGSEFGGSPGRLLAMDPGDSTHLLAVAGNQVIESTNGGTSWGPVAALGAQVSSVQFHPTDGQIAYAATYGDGIFKSLDGGASWSRTIDGIRGANFPHTKGHSLAFDASDANTLYAGSFLHGYRSTDGGATWVAFTDPLGGPWSFASHGGAAGTVHAFTGDPWISTDSGVSWANQATGAFCCFGEGDLVGDPATAATLYVGGHNSGVTGDGFYVSIDSGANWTQPANAGLTKTRIRSLAIDPNNANTLFAGTVDDGTGTQSGLFRTTDGGASWTELNPGTFSADFYPNHIVVHPLDSNLVYLAAEGGPNGGLWRSQDGGNSWQHLMPENGASVAVNPNSTNDVYFATWNTSGFWRSMDGGATWALLNEGLPVQPALDAVVVDPANTNRILLGTAGGVYEIDLGSGTLELTVATNADSGPGSLRDALTQANQDGLPNRIRFAPGMAGSRIDPQSALPSLDEGGTTIDGDVNGDCVPDVEISGQSTCCDGIVVNSAGNVVRGLVINGFPGNGVILAGGAATGNLVECNFIGTDVSGTGPAGNSFGVHLVGGATGNTVGGPGAGNLISGNNGPGLHLLAAHANTISQNGIGKSATGGSLPNTGDGLFLEQGSADNVIGPENIIGNNGGAGIQIVGAGSLRNRITSNTALHDNGGLAIDLGGDGVTFNDPGDGDAGPNDLLNFPEITLVTDNGGGSFTVDGTAPADSTVDLFAAKRDPSGHGEADQFVGSVVADGLGDFSHTFIRPAGLFMVTATATDGAGNSSEVSAAVLLEPNQLVVTNTNDDGPGSLRDAIEQGNADGAPTVITFDPGLAGQTIFVLSNLPDVRDGYTTIDGDLGGDCTPDIEISGGLTPGDTDGLGLLASDNLLRGLAFVHFPGDGVDIFPQPDPADRNAVECSYFGVRLDGMTAAGNGQVGLHVQGGASDNRLGPGNISAFNAWDGVRIADGSSLRNTLTQTATFSNGEEGIDLGGDGVTPNDPGDGDAGPNDLLNFPELTGFTDNGGGSFTIDGTAPPDSTVELFGAAPDPSGFGEGGVFLGSGAADGAGNFSLAVVLPPSVYEVTATATDLAGNTSELSANLEVKTPDAVTAGAAVGFQGDTVALPLFVRDLSVTELGVDQGAGKRIQAWSIQVRFSPAASVVGVTGSAAGITTGLVPSFGPDVVVAGDTATYIVTYNETTNPVPFTLDGAAPGDQVAELQVTLSPTADPTPVAVTVVAGGTSLSNQQGTVEETQAKGSLDLFDGSITVLTRAATSLFAAPLSASSARLTWTDPNSGETGFRIERSPDASSWAAVATVGPDTTELTDTGLDPATLYYYRVISFSGAGDNLPSNTAAVGTFAAAAANACVQQLSQDHTWARFPGVAHNGTRWAAAWFERNVSTNDEIFFQQLRQADGTPTGIPIQISRSDSLSRFPTLRWNGSRFGLLWSEHMRGPAGENTSNSFFALLDANGQPLRRGVRLFEDNLLAFLNSDLELPLIWDGGGWGHFAPALFNPPSSDVAFWRFSEDGEILVGPVQVTDSADVEVDLHADWSGTEYGFVWIRQTGPTYEVFFGRILADGTVPAAPVQIWQNLAGEQAFYTDIVWNGAGWALVWTVIPADESEEAVFIQLLQPDGTPIGGPKRLSDDFDSGAPGSPVFDELPKLLNRPGGGYVCFTSSFELTSFAYEIARLEADANGDRVGSRVLLSDVDGRHSLWTRTATDGTRFLVGYNDQRQGTQEAADVLVAADGSVIAGPNDLTCCHSPAESTTFVAGAADPQVVPFQDGFLTLWRDPIGGVEQLYARIFDGSGALTASLAPLSGRGILGFPGVVAVGDTFAVAWKDPGQTVVFGRYDAAGNSLLGEVEVAQSASGRQMAGLAFSGEVYGVAWYEGNSVVLQRVDSGGGLVGAKIQVADNARSNPIEIQWVGSGWALVWQAQDNNLHFAFVDPFGNLTVPATPVTATGQVRFRYHLLWSGQHLGLAWLDRGDQGADGEIFFELLGLDGSVLLPPVEVAAESGFQQIRLTWQGDRFHLLRGASAVGALEGVVEDEILPDGTLFSSVRKHTNRGSPGGVAFNGATLGLAFNQLREIYFQTSECLQDATPPPCPDLTISFDDVDVLLDWAPVDDAESTIWRYDLYRDGIMLAELFPGTLGYDDGGWRTDFVHTYEVRALNGAYQESAGCTVHTWSTLVGDVNGDGFVDGGDVIYLINFLFSGGAAPLGDADANGDDELTIADLFYLINHVFEGGPAPIPLVPEGVASAASVATDELGVGSRTTVPGGDVVVPITVRDLSVTALNEGQGANQEIQAYTIRVDFAPASAIRGVSFSQAGVTAGKVPRTGTPDVGVDLVNGFVYVIIAFDESSDPLVFDLDAASPEIIGHLFFAVDPETAPGTVQLQVSPGGASVLANDDATIVESVPNGRLAIVDGAITVQDPGAGCVFDLRLSNQTVIVARTYEGCDTITAGTGFAVQSPGNVTFRAGRQVVLEEGFAVSEGAGFRAENDASLAPP